MPLLTYCPILQENKNSKVQILILYSSPVMRVKTRNKAGHSHPDKRDQKNRNRLMTQRGTETYIDCLAMKSFYT